MLDNSGFDLIVRFNSNTKIFEFNFYWIWAYSGSKFQLIDSNDSILIELKFCSSD